MQNEVFYRTGIFGNFFFGGGREFCIFEKGIPGGPGWNVLRFNVLPKIQTRQSQALPLLANGQTACDRTVSKPGKFDEYQLQTGVLISVADVYQQSRMI